MVALAAVAASALAGEPVKNADGEDIRASSYPEELATRPLMLPDGLTEVELAPTLHLFPGVSYPSSMSAGPMWSLYIRRGMGALDLGAQVVTGTDLRPGPIRLDVGFIPGDPYAGLRADFALSASQWGSSSDFLPTYDLFAANLAAPLKLMFGHEAALQVSPGVGVRLPFGEMPTEQFAMVLAADGLFQLNVGPSVAFELGTTPRLMVLENDETAFTLDARAGLFYTDPLFDLGMSVQSPMVPSFLSTWTVATHVRLRLEL
jgi:hypothetical protein